MVAVITFITKVQRRKKEKDEVGHAEKANRGCSELSKQREKG